MTDLFARTLPEGPESTPLAERFRPRRLEEFVGQEHLVGEGTWLRWAIEHDQLRSLILWGPPGSGKTTLARIIAQATGANFVALSAVTSGVKEVKEIIRQAEDARKFHGRKTILFVDEIHRFNKAQQDAFLPYVEKGTIILIGATTENPSFEVNAPLLSRAQVLVLEPLTPEEIRTLLERALADRERGLGDWKVEVEPEALAHLVHIADGDARVALNGLEQAVLLAEPDGEGTRRVTVAQAEAAVQKKALLYDRAGEEHFNLISALHKSVRDSDPDAALYWLARMLEAGEDPLYLARRLVRMAVEDIGLADPRALDLAVAAKEAMHFIGRPEGDLALAEATVYLACAPKSN
ncbi:MAG TPA: replication-associated recombination protein A, partial [Armatimonadetes bacterium]|nr:replication-associated recombination protein A [Armatimonadota bacterium]